jgi:hypothetical protein
VREEAGNGNVSDCDSIQLAKPDPYIYDAVGPVSKVEAIKGWFVQSQYLVRFFHIISSTSSQSHSSSLLAAD